MNKIVLLAFALGAVLSPDLLAYADMSNVTARASDLNMTPENYSFTMAITGALTGTLFGLFIWKVK